MRERDQYARDLEEATMELGALTAQREDLEVKIARTKRKIALLSQLCDETDTLAPIPDLDLGGLTDAVRTALRASRKGWVNTTEIMNGLRELGFPLDKYKAPMASITTTVNRLVEAGYVEINRLPTPGASEYRWVGPNWGAPRSLANQIADYDQDRDRGKHIAAIAKARRIRKL